MSEIEVTPEVLEAVAYAAFDTAIPADIVHTLRDWAGRMRADANPYAVEVGQLVLGVESSGAKDAWFARIGIAVLDKLEADGRLAPEGGAALTVEQLSDLLNVIWEGRGDLSSRDRLRARFPATSNENQTSPDFDIPAAPESWASWQDVPEEVWFESAQETAVKSAWIRKGNEVYSSANVSGAVYTGALDSIAPFVRVKAGDQA